YEQPFNKKNLLLICLLATFFLMTAGTSFSATGNPVAEKPAIVLAVFGTSHVSALPGILDIYHSVQKEFPEREVRLSFTSDIVRRIWQDRRNDKDFINANPGVPKEIFLVKGPLAAIADLQDEGHGYIIVQPTHLASGEEYNDLASCVAAFNSIRTIKAGNMPLQKVILGRPAFGMPGIVHEYHHDIERAAHSLASDVAQARDKDAALVYMGHGNEHFSTGVYIEFADVMRSVYPDVQTYVTTVEGFPSYDVLFRDLKRDKVRKVYLKTLMTVAGDHAKNDMAGDEEDSLKNLLLARGIQVEVDLHGLGENEKFAAVFVANIKDAARDNGLDL
ncbi:MAG: sirohydrochlorin cobaltochelatase, partial [Desulfobulbaceae bacterium]|nr:sirohydrochlorin cobaltochelatase [Desulfobulbaceae bacterium]